MKINFTVSGKPVGKERPRVTRNGTYTPAKTGTAEEAVQWAYRIHKCESFESGVPLYAIIESYFPLLKSDSKAIKQKKIGGEILPTKKPDWDNLGKLACDALNGVAYADDSQIVAGIEIKKYSDRPRTEIFISDDKIEFINKLNEIFGA